MNMQFDELYKRFVKEELSDGTKEYFNRPWDTFGVVVSLDFKLEGHGRDTTIFNPWDIMIDGVPETRALEHTNYNLSKEQWYSFMWDQGTTCKNFQDGLTDVMVYYKNTRIPEHLFRYGRDSLKRNASDLKEIITFLKELNEYVSQLNYDKVTWKFCEYEDNFYGLFVQIPQEEIEKKAYNNIELSDLMGL